MRGRAALGSRAARPPLAAGAGTGLLVFLGAVAFNVVTVDLAAPRAGRTAPLFEELLELGPLVVRDPDRNVRFDGFLDCWHSYDSSASLGSMRRLFALPFLVAAFSSSRCFASRGERVGG